MNDDTGHVCQCACHHPPGGPVTMGACGDPECCDQAGRPSAELEPMTRPALEQTSRHRTIGGRGVVGRIRR